MADKDLHELNYVDDVEEAESHDEDNLVDVKSRKAKSAAKKEDVFEVDAGGGLVTIDLKDPQRFNVGGTWFNLKPGVQKVPKNVKDVLKAAGMLRAI